MMKSLTPAMLLAVALAPFAWAGPNHDTHHVMVEATAPSPSVILQLDPVKLTAKQPTQLVLKLFQAGKPLASSSLQTVHTQKFHLLVVDETLTDYQHLHPQPTANAGEYVASFTPKLPNRYWVWADVTPVGMQQQYIRTELTPAIKGVSQAIKPTLSNTASVNGLNFKLSFDALPQAGSMSMAMLAITDAKGQPFNQLQPVMGAFAHMVGFTADGQSVLHVHPQGEEPTSDAQRGGPTLSFHLEPEKSGFTKLFAQFRISNTDVFVPFGINIK